MHTTDGRVGSHKSRKGPLQNPFRRRIDFVRSVTKGKARKTIEILKLCLIVNKERRIEFST